MIRFNLGEVTSSYRQKDNDKLPNIEADDIERLKAKRYDGK